MKGAPLRSPVISLKDVSKSYKGGFQLGPVDLEIEPGRVVAVLGPNGAGKSTLFGMLMNEQRIGYVPEHAVGHDEMSAKDLGEFVSYWYPNWDQELYEDLVCPMRA